MSAAKTDRRQATCQAVSDTALMTAPPVEKSAAAASTPSRPEAVARTLPSPLAHAAARAIAGEALDRRLDRRPRRVAVGDEAHPVARHRRPEHAARPRPLEEGLGGPRRRRGAAEEVGGHAEDHDVGAHLTGIELDARQLGQRHRQPGGVRVVHGQVRRPLAQGHEPGRGEHPHLPHAAAQHLPHPPRLVDEVARAAEERADRRAEPLGEREHHRVEAGAEARGGDAERRGGVEQAGAVQVDRQPVAAGHGDEGLEPRSVGDRAAGQVVGVLDLDHAGARPIREVGRDGRLDRRRVEQTVGRGERTRQQAGERGHGAHLVMEDVARRVADHLAPRPAVEVERDLVAHGARGHEERRLLPHGRRRLRLEHGDGRVLAIGVVADLGRGHGAAHLVVRFGDGVGAEVDEVRSPHPPAPSPISLPPPGRGGDATYSSSRESSVADRPVPTISSTISRAVPSSHPRTPRLPSRAMAARS